MVIVAAVAAVSVAIGVVSELLLVEEVTETAEVMAAAYPTVVGTVEATVEDMAIVAVVGLEELEVVSVAGKSLQSSFLLRSWLLAVPSTYSFLLSQWSRYWIRWGWLRWSCSRPERPPCSRRTRWVWQRHQTRPRRRRRLWRRRLWRLIAQEDALLRFETPGSMLGWLCMLCG